MDAATILTAAGSIVVSGAATWKAWRAEVQTRNTGNGFAGKVLGDLAEIKESVVRTEGKIDHHIQSHADADVKAR